MASIDVNSDLGEGFGPYRIAPDAELMPLITSANVACGAHAGDPMVMAETILLAKKHSVRLGAHIGYPDRAGFGRKPLVMSSSELELTTIAQLGTLQALAEYHGTKLTHFNFHGALGNLTFSDATVASVLFKAVKAFDSSLHYIGLPDTEALRVAEQEGFKTVRSFLADRGYSAPGRLAVRGTPGALISDPAEVKARVRETLASGRLRLTTGESVPLEVDSILVHSDTPTSLALAKAIREGIVEGGRQIMGY